MHPSSFHIQKEDFNSAVIDLFAVSVDGQDRGHPHHGGNHQMSAAVFQVRSV